MNETAQAVKVEQNTEWPLWEVFAQLHWGKPHEHCGNVHAADAEMALQNARDVYARRFSVKSLWVVPSHAIHATKQEDSEPFFDPQDDKPYRHPSFFKTPKGVKNL